MNSHFLKCNAPICQDCNDNNIIWYAGEEVCNKKPYTQWQKKQLDINKYIKKHTYRYIDMPRRVPDLKKLSI